MSKHSWRCTHITSYNLCTTKPVYFSLLLYTLEHLYFLVSWSWKSTTTSVLTTRHPRQTAYVTDYSGGCTCLCVIFRAPARRPVSVQGFQDALVLLAILNLALRSKFLPRTLPIYTQAHPRAFRKRARALCVLLRATSSFKCVSRLVESCTRELKWPDFYRKIHFDIKIDFSAAISIHT